MTTHAPANGYVRPRTGGESSDVWRVRRGVRLVVRDLQERLRGRRLQERVRDDMRGVPPELHADDGPLRDRQLQQTPHAMHGSAPCGPARAVNHAARCTRGVSTHGRLGVGAHSGRVMAAAVLGGDRGPCSFHEARRARRDDELRRCGCLLHAPRSAPPHRSSEQHSQPTPRSPRFGEASSPIGLVFGGVTLLGEGCPDWRSSLASLEGEPRQREVGANAESTEARRKGHVGAELKAGTPRAVKGTGCASPRAETRDRIY